MIASSIRCTLGRTRCFLGGDARGRRLRRAGEVEEVRSLGLVELKGAGQRFQNAFGNPAQVPALEPRVVGDADSGEDRDLLPAQARHAAGAV